MYGFLCQFLLHHLIHINPVVYTMYGFLWQFLLHHLIHIRAVVSCSVYVKQSA
jgi:hypothetical protein